MRATFEFSDSVRYSASDRLGSSDLRMSCGLRRCPPDHLLVTYGDTGVFFSSYPRRLLPASSRLPTRRGGAWAERGRARRPAIWACWARPAVATPGQRPRAWEREAVERRGGDQPGLTCFCRDGQPWPDTGAMLPEHGLVGRPRRLACVRGVGAWYLGSGV